MKVAIVLLLAVAAYVENGPLFFAVALLLAVLWIVRIWIGRVVAGLRVSRSFEQRLFFGEITDVTIHIENSSVFPIPWLMVRESVPVGFTTPSIVAQVLTIGAQQTGTVTYRLAGRRRGFHALGPLTLTVGDVFGVVQRVVQAPVWQFVIVYPRILAPHELDLPALSLFGDVRGKRRILGDPARVAGVRDYSPGDPLHDIHWRATAAAGSLQVKQYQPATTIQTMIFLDLSRAAYSAADALSAAEFAITVAATVGNHMIALRQEVGLITNGVLPILPDGADLPTQHETTLLLEQGSNPRGAGPDSSKSGAKETTAPALPPAKGRAQLMRVLELLARVELHHGSEPLLQMVTRRGLALPWGSTVVMITGSISDTLFVSLHRLREAGLLVVLFVVEQRIDRAADEARAKALGVKLHFVWQEEDI